MPQNKNSVVAPAMTEGAKDPGDQSGCADDEARIAQRRNASVGNPVGQVSATKSTLRRAATTFVR